MPRNRKFWLAEVLISETLSGSFRAIPNPYDSDHMARTFLMSFPNGAFTVGQEMVFQFTASDEKKTLFALKVKSMEGKFNRFPSASIS